MFHEECGVFGIAGNHDAARLTYLGLYALQHRGQESAGIITWDGETAYQHKAMGLVNRVFSDDTSPSGTSGTRPRGRASWPTRSR
jgi:amidophosphoribosyltransferase